jgi:hypothetical protein
MRLIKAIAISVFIITITYSCVLPYELEVSPYDRVIVVDGVVTTEMDNHSVKLSYTYTIDSYEPLALSGAQVWIEDDMGEIYDFTEMTAGEYKSNLQFAADTDIGYQLFFATDNGSQYSSTIIKPILSPPIKQIYNKYAEIIPINSTTKVGGIQFFLDSDDPTGNAKYFRYEWEETYKIITPFISNYYYDTIADEIIYRDIPISICYLSDSSSSIQVATTAESSQNIITEFPIRFVSGETDLLKNRYSIQVKQYAIDNETYTYYRKLIDTEGKGSLFDEQQGTILGNISSMDNPRETVLGNFEVSGVSSKRVFFNYTDLDHALRYPRYRYNCSNNDIVGTTLDSAGYFFDLPFNNLLIINASINNDPQVIMGPEKCTDCTWFAPNLKPEFWID